MRDLLRNSLWGERKRIAHSFLALDPVALETASPTSCFSGNAPPPSRYTQPSFHGLARVGKENAKYTV